MHLDHLKFDNTNQLNTEAFLQAAMQWHFSEETGSPFWLRKKSTLNFNPLTDVKSFADLTQFPNVANELRSVAMEDLIPRGYGDKPSVVGIFESGGTTGEPKRVICMQDWFDCLLSWSNQNITQHGFPRDLNWLGITPSGPHLAGKLFLESAKSFGKHAFTIDVDPRWVKKLIAKNQLDQSDAYAEHIIDQAAFILKTQDIGVIAITPPLLERITKREELVAIINNKVKAIRWGGTQFDRQLYKRLKTEVFPNVKLYGHYGNTMTLGVGVERYIEDNSGSCIIDSFSPYITYSVINPQTNQPVEYNQRGQLVTNHVSRAFFLPNNLERDLVTRIKPLTDQAGDSIMDIAPVPVFESEAVIEGVY